MRRSVLVLFLLCFEFFNSGERTPRENTMIVSFSPKVAVFAVNQLAAVDYTVANRVTEDISKVVVWAYDNHVEWVPPFAMKILQTFDDLGSVLISVVVWIVLHTKV